MKGRFRLAGFDLRRYRVGPLASYIDQFASRLAEQHYARETARHKLRVVADLSLWLKRRRWDTSDLDEKLITRFLCNRRLYDPIRTGDAAAALLMLKLLRDLGVAEPQSLAKADPPHAIQEDFARYLREERRLSQASLDNTLPFVQRFLSDCFRGRPVALQELHPSHVTRFVLGSINGMSPKRAKLLVGALRSFFRFLQLRGEITLNLTGAVPTVADWKLSSVPKGIDPDDVRQLLKSCDRRTTTGRRDYAILVLLARLGLRAGEVARLTLKDIDWETAEIVIHGKGPRVDRLPLPRDVGEALVAYLRRRPPCRMRQVFVTARAPIRKLARGTVGYVVKRALARANLDAPHKGAHILRHTLAIDMLRRGASLPEIGELLRHRRLDTTAIYAKVDLEALHALALPWPGGVE